MKHCISQLILSIIRCMTKDNNSWANITHEIGVRSYRIKGGHSPVILGRSSMLPQNLWSMDQATNSLHPHFHTRLQLSQSILCWNLHSQIITSIDVKKYIFQCNILVRWMGFAWLMITAFPFPQATLIYLYLILKLRQQCVIHVLYFSIYSHI